MQLIKIINSNDNVSEHFKFSEWFNPALASAKKEFECPQCLIKAMEILRAYFNENWLITSTYRPADTFGFHRYGQAVDSVPFYSANKKNAIIKFREECQKYQQKKSRS